MARDVLEKARNDEALDDDDLKYASERPWIASQLKALGVDVPVLEGPQENDFGTPTGGNVVQTGPAFSQPSQSEPGVFLTEEALAVLKATTLDEIAGAVGFQEMPSRKAAKIAALLGGTETDDDSEDDEDDE